jgi:hypothetical protein
MKNKNPINPKSNPSMTTIFIKQFKINNAKFCITLTPMPANKDKQNPHLLNIYLVVAQNRVPILKQKFTDLLHAAHFADQFCENYAQNGELIQQYDQLIQMGYLLIKNQKH